MESVYFHLGAPTAFESGPRESLVRGLIITTGDPCLKHQPEACEKNTHEYIRDRRHRRSHSPFSPDRDMDSVDALVMLQSESDLEVGSVVEDKFKLVLRSAAIKDITLNVRPTTNCGAIVKAFLKAAGLADVYNDDVSRFWKPKSKPYPQLLIDGEKQHAETKIGDTDLEDGDLVDVVGI